MSSENGKTESPSSNTGQNIIQLSGPALYATLAGLVIAVLIAIFMVSSPVQTHHEQQMIDLATRSIEARINGREEQLRQQLTAAATSIRLTQLIATDDEAERTLEEARLREMIPNAIRVRLFKLREAKVDPAASPPFGYTSVDMINRVEIGQPVHAEAVNAQGRWLLSLAAPIRAPSDPTIRGSLFIYLDPTALADTLGDGQDGSTRILQKIADLPANEIFAHGQNNNGPVISRQLDNPNWQLEFKPAEQVLGEAIISPVDPLIGVLVLTMLSLGGIIFSASRARTQVDHDIRQLASQISEAGRDNHVHTDSYFFEAFTSLDAKLSQLRARPTPTPEAPKLNVTLQPKEPGIEDMIDIEMTDDDSEEMDLSEELEIDETPEEMELSLDEPEPDPATSELETLSSIFRAYDIRGVVGENLTADVVTRIGCAIGTYAEKQGEQTLIVGGDARSSTPELMAALIEGLNVSGRDVISIGTVPTPALYFAVNNAGTANGVMVTGSHNEANYNGLKIVIGGKTLLEEDLQEIYLIFDEGSFSSGSGSVMELDIMTEYTDAIVDDIVIAQPLKVVVDCANGIAGETLPLLFSDLGCDVIPLYCDVDGSFPNHPPDPTIEENLADLINTVINEGADLGLAFDGDADRVMAVTHEGTIIWPDQLLMLFAKDVVSRNPGSDVVYDIKCTRHLNTVISNHGGRPVMSRSGHSFVKAKMAETDAILGGELSGHICFNERWFGFDDGIYAAARLIEIVGSQTETLADLMAEFPVSCWTPEIRVPVAEASKFHVMQNLVDEGGFGDGTITTLDGLRVDYANGWGLVRASNTTPSLTLRFEADDEASLTEIQDLFRNQLQNHNLTF